MIIIKNGSVTEENYLEFVRLMQPQHDNLGYVRQYMRKLVDESEGVSSKDTVHAGDIVVKGRRLSD